jgi:hypothetical protein
MSVSDMPANADAANPQAAARKLRKLRDQLKSELVVELWSTDGEEAREIVDAVLDYVIAALRADRSIPSRSLAGWELFFADAARRAADDLHWLDGLIRPDAAAGIVADYLADRCVSANDDGAT